MAGPHVLGQVNPDRDKIFEFSGSKNFQGASGATASAADGFKFGHLANLQAPPASFTAPCSSEAAYQACLKRVLDVTLTQGLIKQTPMKSCSAKPADDAAYQHYLKRALESTSNKGLIKHFIPGCWKKSGNTSDDLVTDSCISLDNHEVPVHVSQHIPEISPHISAAWGNHPG